jgi:hypothetical protein
MRPLVIAHRQLLLVRHVQVREPGPCRFSCAGAAPHGPPASLTGRSTQLGLKGRGAGLRARTATTGERLPPQSRPLHLLCIALGLAQRGEGNGPLCHAMLCYAMLCYAMLCYAMLRCAVLCYAMLCYAVLCYTISEPAAHPHTARA